MNLFLKYNRAINYERYQLKTPPDKYLAPNSLNIDYTDDESMVTESDEEGYNLLTNQMKKTFYRVDRVNLYSNPNKPAL